MQSRHEGEHQVQRLECCQLTCQQNRRLEQAIGARAALTACTPCDWQQQSCLIRNCSLYATVQMTCLAIPVHARLLLPLRKQTPEAKR